MVKIDSIEIAKGCSYLYIKAHVPDADYFNNITIDNIKIFNAEDYIKNGGTASILYSKVVEDNTKELSLSIKAIDILADLSKDLLVVVITTKGNYGSDTPCGLDTNITESCVYNKCAIYNNMMSLIADINDNCSTPNALIDYYLTLKGLDISIEEGNINLVKLLYDNLTTNNIYNIIKCNCHG